MAAYYNEFDPFAAQWLRNLIKKGLIADGEVDTRSIEDVTPNDLREFTQVHMFAGIGVWPYALRKAGFPDSRRCWTGSCPCQPFSKAGKGNGFADERHLWPAWYHLIQAHNPELIFGEQVASDDGLAWLDLVQSDLENQAYSIEAFDLAAAGFGAPHIRQRIYFAADRLVDSDLCEYGKESRSIITSPRTTISDWEDVIGSGQPDRASNNVRGLANTSSERLQGRIPGGQDQKWEIQHGSFGCVHSAGDTFWGDCEWLPCKDGKWRPIEPGTFPLVNGSSSRMGPVRAYGNAITAPAAIGFVQAYLQAESLRLEFGGLI